MKAGCDCCKLPLNTTKEDDEKEEATIGVDAAEEIRVDATVADVFLQKWVAFSH